VKRESVGPAVLVESLDQEGRGVAHVDGKVVFIEGALAGEVVEFASYRRKPNYEFAEATRIVRASASRVDPRCRHFGVCGGCSMQHLEPRAQVAAKQRVLEENLARIGKVTAETMLSPIHGPTWGYRYRARFSARYVAKKGTLVGFRERHSSFVADMQTCEVVPARISALLVPLRLEDGSLAEGVVDLAFREDGEWTVVDFKTDRDLAVHRASYQAQVRIYAAAVAAATGEATRGALLVL